MTSSITYRIVTLIIDGKTSVLQLLDVQNVRKIKELLKILTVCSRWRNRYIDYEGFVHILIFLCVRIELN